jgi:hypothetical protein
VALHDHTTGRYGERRKTPGRLPFCPFGPSPPPSTTCRRCVLDARRRRGYR